MVSATYARAYTEVLELIKHLSSDELAKIPESEIEFYKSNMDTNYSFSINPEIPLNEQNISIEANAVIVSIFKNYFASEKQKEILENLLAQNQAKKEEELREKYNPDKIFDNSGTIMTNQLNKDNSIEEVKQEKETMAMTVKKESFLTKIWSFIKGIFKK